jgi:hypothetical protein
MSFFGDSDDFLGQMSEMARRFDQNEVLQGSGSLLNQQAQNSGASSYINDSFRYSQAATLESGTLTLQSGSTSGIIAITNHPLIEYKWQSNPNMHGESFLQSLDNILTDYVKELIVTTDIYYQILGVMRIDIKINPEAEKELYYHLPYGMILLKNEKFQFDLDKYIEDAEAKK